jgi:hypothetical protein
VVFVVSAVTLPAVGTTAAHSSSSTDSWKITWSSIRCGLVGKLDGRRKLARPRRRWENNIKMCLQELEWEAWNRLIWLRIGTGGRLLWMW